MVITHLRPSAANWLLVEMDNGSLVLVDTPNHAPATRNLLAWMRSRYGSRRKRSSDCQSPAPLPVTPSAADEPSDRSFTKEKK